MKPNDSEKLERLIHRTLRELPARRAPRSLEARVLAEVARRDALPWWRKSYASWPTPVRNAFFVLSAAIAAGIIAALFALTRSSVAAEAAGQVASRFEWIALVRSLGVGVAEKAGVVFRAIPPFWLYGTLAVVASCYATLIGVGAAAYRTLRVQR